MLIYYVIYFNLNKQPTYYFLIFPFETVCPWLGVGLGVGTAGFDVELGFD
jgi:hypothetical protein